jgi:ergothioneine biosynthesis protein EgtB
MTVLEAAHETDTARRQLLDRYRRTRALSIELCRPLKAEDYRVQSMPDVSPPWWNLGHTSWFFAKNILEPFGMYSEEDAALEFVLNSYYVALGPRIARDHRGLITRPTTDRIYRFRASVDERMEELIQEVDSGELERVLEYALIGINHEQQHQELLLTEVKHILGTNARGLREPYQAGAVAAAGPAVAAEAIEFEGGLYEFGNTDGGWCWDNELGVHRAWLDDFALMNRLITNREYLAFIEDGGYQEPLLWLSNGWTTVETEGWTAPLYWEKVDGEWLSWTLSGTRPVALEEPVCHVSFYEADAFARWKSANDAAWNGARLPSEREWEHAARASGFSSARGNFLDSRILHPTAATPPRGGLSQMAGDLWEWTVNHYEPYPRYRPFEGSIAEYNGKFMDNQRVLRGGSCATPADHIRVSYRNFWPAGTRFQFTGIRLARTT